MHLIIGGCATPEHPAVRRSLARHPRHHLHFTPTYASWLNQVERWFGLITRRAIRRASRRSVGRLVRRIDEFVASCNDKARPFLWTATADSILGKIERLCTVSTGTSH